MMSARRPAGAPPSSACPKGTPPMPTPATCAVCAAPLQPLTIPLRLVQEGVGHDTTAQAYICPNDDRHPGLVLEARPRRLASGAIRRLAFWGEHDRQTRAKGLARPA
jgi:hypothetical protein